MSRSSTISEVGVLLYVAADGSDRNQGSEGSPFATLARAKDAVRELKAERPRPVRVVVRGGTYYLPEPLVFGPQDSGSGEHPITYAAHPGEVVTLSGGARLDCRWEPHRDGIMKCSLADAGQGDLPFTQLFVDGARQIRARYPNYDAEDPFPNGSGYLQMVDRTLDWPATHFYFDPETFTKNQWAKPSEAVVHTFPEAYIGNLQWQVRDVDWDAHRVDLGAGGSQMNDLTFKAICSGIGPRSRFFIENVFEELDAPGEWYLDRDAGILYFLPAEDVDLDHALVEAPALDRLITFDGSQGEPVSHITLSGFRLAHTASTYLEEYEVPSLGDWSIHRGGAIFLEGAEDCRIEECFFDGVGGNAVFVNDYNRRIAVTGNRFTGVGDSAICLVGSRHRTLGSQRAFPADNVVSNNLIHDCGVFGKQTAGVFSSISQSNVISHNLIFRMPRAGIVINDGWGGGHVIEFNKVYDTCRETSDHGSFNSWGRESFWCKQQAHGPVSHGPGTVKEDARLTTVIRNNYFREDDIIEWTIDLDDGTANYHVYNNLSIGAGIKLREGAHRTVENNIMFHPINPPGFQVAYEYNNDRFVRNIIVATSQPAERPRRHPIDFLKRPGVGSDLGDIYANVFPPAEGPMAEEVDYNCFFSDVGEFFSSTITRDGVRNRYTLEQWREMGYDEHSVFADPLFVDAENGDYRVRPDSPALQLGFENFDIDRAGLLPDFPARWLDDSARQALAL